MVILNGRDDNGFVISPVSVIILHVSVSFPDTTAASSPDGTSPDEITVTKHTINSPIKYIMPRIVKFIKEFSAKYETIIKGAKRNAMYNI